VNFALSEKENFTYNGYCQPDRNMIEIVFLNDWRLELYFYREATTFIFNHVFLYYKLNGPRFPYSLHEGAQSEVYDYVYINSTLLQSYTCMTGIRIDLGEVVIHMKELRVEPFFNKRPNAGFDSEIKCIGDERLIVRNNINNAWSILLAVVFFSLIFCCCVLFIVLKARNDRNSDKKNPYDSVKTSPLPQETLDEEDVDNKSWVRRV
jgi:hypothetical protein